MATVEELERKIAELTAEKEESRTLNIKIGNKRNVVVGGPALGQRFPVTLYAPSWLVLLDEDNIRRIKQFIEDNKEELSWER